MYTQILIVVGCALFLCGLVAIIVLSLPSRTAEKGIEVSPTANGEGTPEGETVAEVTEDETASDTPKDKEVIDVIHEDAESELVLPELHLERNSSIPCKFSGKLFLPLVEVWFNGSKRYVVFDSGSNLFWVAQSCKDQCQSYLADICRDCNPSIPLSNMLDYEQIGCGDCSSCLCRYGACGPSTSTQTCRVGQSCEVRITPKKTKLTIAGQTVCVYIGLASGYAADCGGIPGIMGTGDFANGAVDKTSFLYNYFLAEGKTGKFPKDVMNYSFSFISPSPFYDIDVSVTMQDTNLAQLQWMKRYSLTGMPYITVRLLEVRANGSTIFTPSAPQYIILDTGAAGGGVYAPALSEAITKVTTDNQGYILRNGPTLEFIFEGLHEDKVAWPYKPHEYYFDLGALQSGRYTSGTTFMFAKNSGAMLDILGPNTSLAGNLFLANKRTLFDFAQNRVGSEILSKGESSMQLRNLQTHIVEPLERLRPTSYKFGVPISQKPIRQLKVQSARMQRAIQPDVLYDIPECTK